MKLAEKKCVACEGDVPPLSKNEAEILLRQIPGWSLSDDAKSISKEFKFKDFIEAMNFANKITEVAEAEGHHPDLAISWGTVGISLTTHAIKGLSENDLI